MRILKLLAVASLASLTACISGTQSYQPPAISMKIPNSVTIKETKDVVWKRMVTNLSKDFYVINNLDKETGLINISYSSDPEAIIDCGRVTIDVSGPRPQSSTFAGAQAHTNYIGTMGKPEVMVNVTRRISVEGRSNILVQPVSAKETIVTANVRYIVSKDISTNMGHRMSSKATFNSKNEGAFDDNSPTRCRPTGKFESDILNAAKAQ